MSDSGKLTVNYFCVGAFFIFIGSVLLCALGFTVVLPFEVTRAWPSVQCTVINSTYDPNVCSCDEQLNVFDTCVSKYPCLQIHVFYVPPPGSGVQVLLSPTTHNRTTDAEGGGGRGEGGGGEGRAGGGAGGGVGRGVGRGVGAAAAAAAAGGWSVTRRVGVDGRRRRQRSVEWIGEELNASDLFHVGNVFQTVDVDSRNVVSGHPVKDTTTAAMVESLAVTDRDGRIMVDTVTTEDLELDGGVLGGSLLSSTLFPVGKSHSSKDVGLDTWTVDPDVVQSGVFENWTDLLRMSKHEADDDNGIETVDERRGGGGGVGEGGRVFATLYRSWDDSFNRQCSLTECGDETWNVKEARRFRDDWGRIGQPLPCFYNPLRPDMVIIERTSTVAAVHAVLWPGLCLIAGITLWIGLCLRCWAPLGADGSTCKDDYGPIY